MAFFDEPAGPRPRSSSDVFFGINPDTGTFVQHSAPRALVEEWRFEVRRLAHAKLSQHREERGATDDPEPKHARLDEWVRSNLDMILLGPPTSLLRIKPTFDELLLSAPQLLTVVQRTRRSLSLYGPACFDVTKFVGRFTAVVRSTVLKERDARPNTRKRLRDDGPLDKVHLLLLLLPRAARHLRTMSELEQFATGVVGTEKTNVLVKKTLMSLYQSRMDDLKREVTEKKCVLSGLVGGVRLPLEVRDAIARMAVLG